jgi:23S rRNA (guanosine2251-2'-O)-methyltransferase
MVDLVLVAHNVRSAHNVGSLLRTADGVGITKVYLSGYSPYPLKPGDVRLPHIARSVNQKIAKTSLGAEKSVAWEYSEDVVDVMKSLKKRGYKLAALEQAANSVPLPDFKLPQKLALIVGSETNGLQPRLLEKCDHVLEIPMLGAKESFNVAQATAMALYHLRFIKKLA